MSDLLGWNDIANHSEKAGRSDHCSDLVPTSVWKEDLEDFARRSAFERQASSGGLLLGRKTFVGRARFWPEQTGNWADMVNGPPKSRTQSRG
jgi:hypothetical protein